MSEEKRTFRSETVVSPSALRLEPAKDPSAKYCAPNGPRGRCRRGAAETGSKYRRWLR